MKFTIEKVCRLTGLSAVTLRNWEKRYGFPSPQRAGSGHRFYGSDDIEFLRMVKEWIACGHNLSQIGEFYKEKRSELDRHKTASVSLIDDVDYREQLLYECLISFNSTDALGHYNILNAKLSPEQFLDRVIEKVLRKIREEFIQKKISLAQEHFASSFLRVRLMSFLSLDLPIAQPMKILSATMASERYEGGLLLVTAHLKFRGYPVNYFGPDLPIEDVIELAMAMKPKCVVLSYYDRKRFLSDMKVIQSSKIPACFGGRAFSDESLMQLAKKTYPTYHFFSSRHAGSEAASFVEMICQAR